MNMLITESNKIMKSHCDLCNTAMQSQEDLVKHIDSYHKSIDDQFYCRKCNFCTTIYSEIVIHNNECNGCGKSLKSFERLENTQHNSIGIFQHDKKLEKNFTCNTCGKRFAFSCLLQDHINLHTGDKPYLCPSCGRSFFQRASLKQHARRHNSIRPHKCPQCSQGFYGKGDLKKHLRRHTGERPYVCEMCGEGFSQSSHLGMHKKTHTGERPFSCDICSRSFTKKGDMSRHRRIHTGEFPYLCQVCGRAFRQSTQCATHIKNHHPNCTTTIASNNSKSKPIVYHTAS